MTAAPSTRNYHLTAAAIAVGLCSAAIVVAPSSWIALVIAALLAVVPLVWWILGGPRRWLLLLFAAALLAPPLPIDFGSAGPHIAVVFAGAGLFAGVVRLAEWRKMKSEGVGFPLAVFLLILFASTGFAAIYSGFAIAAGTLARVLLFGIGAYVFVYTVAGPGSRHDELPLTRALFWIAVIAAAFACVDFYFQFPAPAGYGPQFVWLDSGIFRRAQGFFYEASTLGNFCAFFIVMVAVALFLPRESRPCSQPTLIAGGVVFCGALILSYSRASLLNVLVALAALVYLRKLPLRRILSVGAVGAAVAAILVYVSFPEFAQSYWLRLSSSLAYLWSAPNSVLSGRVASWGTLLSFLERQPWQAVFGIGYKTLPYSDYAGVRIIADNTYLSLLIETGVVGLVAFLALNFAIVRAAFRAAHSSRPRAAFFGTWIFCFWSGQIVQMFSGDLITYWRVLPLYFWALGVAVADLGEAHEHPLR
jgi:O-antigen ligase